jgi:putative hemolysin
LSWRALQKEITRCCVYREEGKGKNIMENTRSCVHKEMKAVGVTFWFQEQKL